MDQDSDQIEMLPVLTQGKGKVKVNELGGCSTGWTAATMSGPIGVQ